MDLESGAAESAPNPDSSGPTTGAGDAPAPGGQTPGQAIVDITDPDRYRYEGRPLKEWQSGYMRQQDYSSKTQALAQERRYFDNLAVDLDRVRQNPHLVEQFRQVYPEKFHAYLRYVASENPQAPQPTGPGQPPGQAQYAQLDPRFLAEFNRMKEATHQREVQAISAELDAIYGRMKEKYPFALEDSVTALAQSVLNKLREQDPQNPDVRISEKQWDALWKSQNDRAQKQAEAQYKKQVKAQIEASQRAGSAGGGGGVPGQAPRQFKTIKEATAAALADVENGAF